MRRSWCYQQIRGVTVVMFTQSYLDKGQELLKDGKTYQKLKRDPTSNYQEKFKEDLWDLKVGGVITYKMHHDLFPTTDQPPACLLLWGPQKT